jgi:molybdopterin-containing oxidoreductase family iron-sulfur binding subunit
MSPIDKGTTGRSYWRSLDDLEGDPEVRELVHREFAHFLPDDLSAGSRRQFLKIMGASIALAGASGCGNPTWPRWPAAKILPHAYRSPEERPGTPVHFATCWEMGGVAKPLLVRSYDGRPIKIEGNPQHPASLGAADAWSQASVLEFYDPDRSHGPSRNQGRTETATSWDAFQAEMMAALEKLAAVGGRGLRILSEASSSPTLRHERDELLRRMPEARWHEWEPLSRDAAREGSRLAYGRPLRTHYDFAHADVVVGFEDDFLVTHPAAVTHARAFAGKRRVENGSMNRLHVVESAFSVTGSQADHRVAVPSREVSQAAWALAAELFLGGGLPLPDAFAHLRAPLEAARPLGLRLPFVRAIAADLLRAKGHGIVAVGPSQPPSVHALAHVVNAALLNIGRAVRYTEEPDPARTPHLESLRELASDMHRGAVDTLLVLGGNPAFDAPADFDFPGALTKTARTAHLSLHRNETSRACVFHLPRAHALESWSDALSWDGTYTIGQPLIQPLYEGRTPAELVALLREGRPVPGRDLVERTFVREELGDAGAFRRAIHDGFAGPPAAEVVPALDGTGWRPEASDFAGEPEAGGRIEVVFLPDYSVWDGRFANNGWLQEWPDPMTKIAWDNAALIDPATAREHGVSQGDLLILRRGDRTLELPAFLMPGQARGSIAVSLGYGRRDGGRLAERDSDGKGGGFDAYPFRTSDAMWSAGAVEWSRNGGRYDLATTQNHHALFNAQQGRGEARRLPEIFREATLDEYRHHPDFAEHRTHHPPLLSLWEERSYDKGPQWGMAIDLNACTGCGACVIACQAENNVPVVGKNEVKRGREMHWIRIDRYFDGDPASPRVAHQPVTCQQCENAPCEQVCPVAATTHSDEGLNDMVYNRCIGTRYCNNNCPYKVRRFNWFNNQKGMPDILKMQLNPDVTVRSRGVMEKCTFCIQRIKAVTIPARNEKRQIKDGEIVPACAQTCPADAIVFGDISDPESRVAKLHQNERAYAMLSELNVKPRNRFLAKIRNPLGTGDGHDEGAATHGAREHS